MAKMRTNSRPITNNGLLAVLMCLTVVLVGTACSKSNSSTDKTRKDRAVPVIVSEAIQKDVPLEVNTFGKAQSKASVTIKAKVSQVIQTVHFNEGDKIARGALLFTLDSRPYKVALEQAQVALARDRVLEAGMQADLRRGGELLKNGMLAQAEYDKLKTNADALAETLKADQTAIEAAQINVDACRITSPIDGRAGKVLLHAGNLTAANDLVVINQIKPMVVFFPLPQSELDRVRSYKNKAELEVVVTVPDDPGHPMKGRLTFLDNLVDTGSGTIELGATFPNLDERLWPGRYVLVHLALTVQRGAIVVPQRAIVTSSLGQSVFVVKDDQTVEQRMVKVERARGEDTVIAEGLKAGERVVVDGQLQLEDGTRIEIRSTPPSTASQGAHP